MNVWLRAAGGAAVVALALVAAAGCGKSAPKDPATPGATAGMGAASPATTAATTTATSPSAAASAVLADGRSPVYLTGLNAGAKTVTFDLIEFLTGDEAKKEWKKEHPDQPDGPDNDYMIINNNKKLRTLPVAADAKCVVLATLGSTDTKSITFAALPAFVKQHNKGLTLPPQQISVLPFWLTVKNGKVVKLEEQFLP